MVVGIDVLSRKRLARSPARVAGCFERAARVEKQSAPCRFGQIPRPFGQPHFALVFDRSRHHALYIFEHVYGEDRDRGSAMVDLLEEYRRYGYELGDDELPDYLPALLEFFSHIPADEAQKLLGDAVHVVAHLAKKLELYGSPYAALLNAVVALSPVEPQPLIEPPVRDMDEAMETFGPDNQGLEPLLKPKMGGLQTVQFYPTGNRPNA